MLRRVLLPMTFALVVSYQPSKLSGCLQRREAMLTIGGGAALAARRPVLAVEPDASASDAERQKEEAKERLRQKIEASKKNYRPASSLLDDRRAKATDDNGGKDEPRQASPNGGIVEDL